MSARTYLTGNVRCWCSSWQPMAFSVVARPRRRLLIDGPPEAATRTSRREQRRAAGADVSLAEFFCLGLLALLFGAAIYLALAARAGAI